MKIRELMVSPVHVCRPQDSLERAAQLLWEHDCGVLPVVDRDGRVGAAITDRDICMGAYTRGSRLADLRVMDSMSRGIETCTADEDVSVVAERMAGHQVRRLPVVDESGKAIGIVSLNDIALAGETDAKIGREASKVLIASCRRRTKEHEKVTPALRSAERKAGGGSKESAVQA